MEGYLVWFWFACVWCGAVIGRRHEAGFLGGLLGCFFGPLGVLAAFALDSRPACPNCGTRIAGDKFRPKVCPACAAELNWQEGAAPHAGWQRYNLLVPLEQLPDQQRREYRAAAEIETRRLNREREEQAKKAAKAMEKSPARGKPPAPPAKPVYPDFTPGPGM